MALSHIHSREASVHKGAVSHLWGPVGTRNPPLCKQLARREVTSSHSGQGLAVCSGTLTGVLTRAAVTASAGLWPDRFCTDGRLCWSPSWSQGGAGPELMLDAGLG